MIQAYEAIYDHGKVIWQGNPPEEGRFKAIVLVMGPADGGQADHDEWVRFSLSSLESAYGPDEPDYTLEDIKWR